MKSSSVFHTSALRVVLTALFSLAAGIASAQNAAGPILSAFGSALVSDDHSAWAGSVSFGYRFNSSVELQIEFTGAPEVSHRSDGPRIAESRQSRVAETFVQRATGGRAGAAGFPSTDLVMSGLRTSLFPIRDEPGRALLFTTNARIHLPLTTSRFAPYMTAGGGVGQLQRRQIIDYGPIFLPPFVNFSAPGLPVGPGVDPQYRQEYAFTETVMVLTLGGGLAVKVTDRFSVDADLRYFRTLGNQDTNIGRFGAGVSYRF
jgi:opacity protein-like surface antigen